MALGPSSVLAIQFSGNKFHGQILSALVELVQSKTVRVIDAVAVKKDENGKVESLELEQLAANDLHIFDPLNAQITGLLSNDDINDIAAALENNTAAGLLVLEHLWAVRLVDAIQSAGGKVVMNRLLMPEVVEENLELIANIV